MTSRCKCAFLSVNPAHLVLSYLILQALLHIFSCGPIGCCVKVAACLFYSLDSGAAYSLLGMKASQGAAQRGGRPLTSCTEASSRPSLT